jgi:membrane protease YdiL (CAAX protease family)
MSTLSRSTSGGLKKSLFFLLFFILEAAVFAIIPFSEIVPAGTLVYIQTGLAALLLAAALILRRGEATRQYWQVCMAFLTAALAVLLGTLFSGKLLVLLNLTTDTPQGIAVAKLSESLCRVVPLLVVMALAGADRRSLYLVKGRIGLGLAVGAAGAAVFIAIALIGVAGQQGVLGRLFSLLPWILIFVFANGFMEELLFRGLFLQRYEPFLGKGLSILLTAVVFTLVHAQVTYSSDVLLLLAIIFPLSLFWAWLMQKTGSLWGAVLFHAGADCLIIFGAFASL